jgi:hypothetical protein
MQPAAYPPAPVISAEPLKPSAWWYGIAAAIGTAAIAIAVVVFVQTISGLVDRVDDFQRMSLPASGSFTIEDTGGYTVYHEFPGASGSSFGSGLFVEITGPDGSEVETETYDADVSYSWGDHEGIASYSFTADQPGEYTISAEGGTGEVAIGRGIGSGLVGGLVGSFAVGIVGCLVAGILAIVVAIKRGKNRRGRMTYGPQYGPGPIGGPGNQPSWPGAAQPGWAPQQPPPQAHPGPYAPPQPPPGQYPPGPMQPPPGLPPT